MASIIKTITNTLGDKSTQASTKDKKKNSESLSEILDENTKALNQLNASIEKLGGKGLNFNTDSDENPIAAEALNQVSSKFGDKMGGLFDKFGDKLSGMFGSGGSGGGVLAIINKVLETIRGILSSINSTLEQGVKESIENQKNYLGPISSRLQTVNPKEQIDAYYDLSYNIRNMFTASAFVNQQKLLGNIAKLVEQGIGYNIEDRAYLETIKDKVVSTFDILDVNLNRIIRLQQTDLTRSQMGLEAQLTQFLNTNFQDTSYLNGLYDSVTGTLLDATSQMNATDTTGYLYNVQKWLSSLYALGISDSAISTIAQGLNYLGSGNVSALTGNDTLNTLFAMAAQQGGLSYAQLLTTGTSAEQVDTLLKSMVEYLQSIANNTSSEVLRNEYGRIFGGFSVSDLRAIQNLTADDIKAISDSTTSYKQAVETLREQINFGVTNRTTLSEQVENAFKNLIYSIGAGVAENPETYKNYLVAGLIEDFGDSLSGIPVVGELVSNIIGVGAEAYRTSLFLNAANDLDISNNTKYYTGFVGANGEYFAGLDDLIAYDEQWGTHYADQYRTGTEAYATGTVIPGIISNFLDYANVGGEDILSMLIDNGLWQQGTSRSGLSFSTAYGSNIFDTTAAQIEEASNKVQGVEDTLSQSLDDIYEGLFSDSARPIRVVITDIDGEVLGSMNTNSYYSNRDVEENYGDVIRKLRISAAAQE